MPDVWTMTRCLDQLARLDHTTVRIQVNPLDLGDDQLSTLDQVVIEQEFQPGSANELAEALRMLIVMAKNERNMT